jgi:hypothetical protein
MSAKYPDISLGQVKEQIRKARQGTEAMKKAIVSDQRLREARREVAQGIQIMTDEEFKPVKLGWRSRLARWIAPSSAYQVTVGSAKASSMPFTPSGYAMNLAEAEEKQNYIEGGARFRIIEATNGKIVAYTPVSATRIGEEYYVVPEGQDLLGALAACLALDRIKS